MSDMHVRLEGYWKKRLRLRAMENAEDEEYRWLTTVNLCDYAILVVVDQLMNVTGVILLESMNATRLRRMQLVPMPQMGGQKAPVPRSMLLKLLYNVHEFQNSNGNNNKSHSRGGSKKHPGVQCHQ